MNDNFVFVESPGYTGSVKHNASKLYFSFFLQNTFRCLTRQCSQNLSTWEPSLKFVLKATKKQGTRDRERWSCIASLGVLRGGPATGRRNLGVALRFIFSCAPMVAGLGASCLTRPTVAEFIIHPKKREFMEALFSLECTYCFCSSQSSFWSMHCRAGKMRVVLITGIGQLALRC